MGKRVQIGVIVLSALSFLSLLNVAQGNPMFYVEGKVYCDTCRAQFVTRVSVFMAGAKVKLQCRESEGSENVTYSVEGETDKNGLYSLPVDGDHENEICEVSLLSSPDPDCSEIGREGWANAVSRVTLTNNNGMADPVRQANPLGFMKKVALPVCIDVYKEMGMLPPHM